MRSESNDRRGNTGILGRKKRRVMKISREVLDGRSLGCG